MATPDLPADLADPERRLERRSRQEPPAGLRERVLAAVRGDPVPTDAGGFWRFAAAVAAAALLAMNLSMSAANDTDWRLAAVPASDVRGGERIRALSPETSEAEASRQELLLVGRARLTPRAAVSRPSRALSIFSDE